MKYPKYLKKIKNKMYFFIFNDISFISHYIYTNKVRISSILSVSIYFYCTTFSAVY